MERRSFIAALFGGAAAAPVVAQQALSSGATALMPLGTGIAGDLAKFEHLAAPLLPARMSFGVGRGSDRYCTGDPSIDALRSVSGVYKALMERRKAR